MLFSYNLVFFRLIWGNKTVLSDQKKRWMYNIGLYDPQDEEDEGFADFLQEMSSLMENDKKEEKEYSFGEIQTMFWEMAQSFNHSMDEYKEPSWCQDIFTSDDEPRSSKKRRAVLDPLAQFSEPDFGRQETKCI
ncbi:hypothetical protein Ccrd_000246 [Cynara cardunculus var. scolymus]|uniref:Uncharacterized protein n=1 Tax=Cynara cardunculus var. scolymus TaxID=59895 RepID=A0A118JXS8_CYNCS|nr:hypothetical protein Ccrd_000246 [Cynara cardunculus var. scolymus]